MVRSPNRESQTKAHELCFLSTFDFDLTYAAAAPFIDLSTQVAMCKFCYICRRDKQFDLFHIIIHVPN